MTTTKTVQKKGEITPRESLMSQPKELQKFQLNRTHPIPCQGVDCFNHIRMCSLIQDSDDAYTLRYRDQSVNHMRGGNVLCAGQFVLHMLKMDNYIHRYTSMDAARC